MGTQVERLNEYFENTPREVVEKEWHEYDKYNEVGPAVDKYLKYVNTIRQPQYPKTYEECHKLMVQWKEYDCNPNSELILCEAPIHDFCKIIVARNIYWKIAGEKMGLGKPWEPDWKGNSWRKLKYCITVNGDGELERRITQFDRRIFAFPTEEMMNAFYENFKDKLEICKEFI